MSDGLGGIFGGGGGGGGFNFLDPLGLGNMVQGLLGGLMKGDLGGIASMGQSVLGGVTGQSQNQVGGFDPSQMAGQAGQGDPASSQATTEMAQQSDPAKAKTGYASTAAADPEERKALMTALAQFSEFDFQGCPWSGAKDGLFDRGNLQAIVGDSYFDAHPDIKQAAQYLLDHPELMNQLTIESGRTDGCVSFQAIAQHVKQMSQPENQGSGAVPPDLSSPPTQSSPPGTDTIRGHSDAVQQSGGTARETNKAIEELINQRAQGASSTQSSQSSSSVAGSSATTGSAPRSMDEMADRLATLREKLYSGDLTESEKMQFQDLSNRMSEMFTMMSNVQKLLHDMAMTAINNIR